MRMNVLAWSHNRVSSFFDMQIFAPGVLLDRSRCTLAVVALICYFRYRVNRGDVTVTRSHEKGWVSTGACGYLPFFILKVWSSTFLNRHTRIVCLHIF